VPGRCEDAFQFTIQPTLKKIVFSPAALYIAAAFDQGFVLKRLRTPAGMAAFFVFARLGHF